MAIVLLSNRVNPTRDNPRWAPVRAKIADLVMTALFEDARMTLELSDWLIVALYFVASAAIGLVYTRKASQSLDDYFVSGRALPWWLAGTSMVATTFAADTPLVVAGLVAKYGVAGNWLWWNGALSGILTVFFFARLWRRAGVLTDLEFAELRYGGKPAAVLRGFRALYLALPVNLIIMGWVTRAMVTILHITLNINPWTRGHPAVRGHRRLQRLLRPLGRDCHRHLPVRREDGRCHSCSRSSR